VAICHPKVSLVNTNKPLKTNEPGRKNTKKNKAEATFVGMTAGTTHTISA
jgi:hypothetical protein